jgi:hypothetical protein
MTRSSSADTSGLSRTGKAGVPCRIPSKMAAEVVPENGSRPVAIS